ncbi:inositol monophosphatase family protein [Paenibacillus herberti]|uniref:Inositol-1-monophosphatase n=1 Tax=Paenibacillus herberti TaxID=1619309 RepID=A0A229P2J0_9BACL|nr:inositol monophosphatase family protein [Paenibacillus herberti]OXM16271.1 inositol monophosphatase [Paenibacillus herberti]
MSQEFEESLLQSAIDYAKQAGELIRAQTGNWDQILEKKNGSDLVTNVDLLSEALLKSLISAHYSDHWILSEEDNGALNSYEALISKGAGYGWVIDPIDGTTNFIHGIPHFAVSIGIVRDQESIIGVVYNPLTEELFHARRNGGACRNGKVITSGREQKLQEALLATGFQAEQWAPQSLLVKQMDHLAGACRNLRIIGAASLDLCWIAMGRLTGFWHKGLHPWDTSAGALILREAGGRLTDFDGNEYELHHDTLVASNSTIHDELLAGLKR